MPWSIFQQGGGAGAAETWAIDYLNMAGLPDTPVTEQFVFDWEESEGGGGKFNPLNQGPVPGQPQLTSTGSQYGGGAADFVSWQAGLKGAVDYLNMPAYSGVKRALQSNNYAAAEKALWNSPWASSHYGYGALWSTKPLPGKKTALIGGSGLPGAVTTVSATSGFDILDPLTWPAALFNSSSWSDMLERLGFIILGGLLILLGIWILAGKEIIQLGSTAAKAAEVAAV